MDCKSYRPNEKCNTKNLTTLAGNPVPDTMHTMTVGTRGPALMEDFHLQEKIANFDRERIPERVVHARGATAKGTFTCTRDMSEVTVAKLFHKDEVTELALRFSTVIHSRHSPETLRDPRGFAVKFYTKEGNFDMVGLNFPVFFIRDGISFVDLVHSLKPSIRTEKQQWSRILDFLSFRPECMHILTFLLDDEGIPRDYMHMPGYSIHSYVFVNKDGKRTYAKLHFLPEDGIKSIETDNEAIQVGGKDFSHATHALIDAIDRGHFPAWKMYVQLMDPESEMEYCWGDPLDATKAWPEKDFPLVEVGRLELNKNVDNQFLENEQIAFNPSQIVPGIEYSEDKLLQSRLFSYGDTQRYRIGSNYLQLPINAPRCPFFNGHHDGSMNFMHRENDVNYFPSHKVNTKAAENYPKPEEYEVRGTKQRVSIKNENNFQQAGERWRSFDDARKERFIDRVVMTLTDDGMTDELCKIWLGYWTKCDRDLGGRIAKKFAEQKM